MLPSPDEAIIGTVTVRPAHNGVTSVLHHQQSGSCQETHGIHSLLSDMVQPPMMADDGQEAPPERDLPLWFTTHRGSFAASMQLPILTSEPIAHLLRREENRDKWVG